MYTCSRSKTYHVRHWKKQIIFFFNCVTFPMTSWLKNILFQTINLHIFTTSEIPPLDMSNKDITSVLHKYSLEEYISNFLLETGIFPNKTAWNFKKVFKSEIFRYERSLMDQSVIKHLIYMIRTLRHYYP